MVVNDRKVQTILDSCIAWYNDHEDALETLVRTISREEVFSLRLIDWLTTNYSKRNRLETIYEGRPLDVHLDYRRFLAVFTKKYFDPFARRDRLQVLLEPDGKVLTTTVGQLNFMRWFLHKNVDTILRGMQPDIERDMREYEGCRKLSKVTSAAVRLTISKGPFHLDF